MNLALTKSRKVALAAVAGLIVLGAAGVLLYPRFFPDRSTKGILGDVGERIAHHPKYIERIKEASPIEAKRMASELSQSGLRRLSDVLMEERAGFFRDWVNQSEEATCAALWSGADEGTITRLINSLPPERLRRWWEINVAAAVAELEEHPVIELTEDDMAYAFGAIYLAIPKDDAKRLAKNFEATEGEEKLAPIETCWTARTVFNTIPKLKQPHRKVLIRVLATGQ